MQLLPITFVPIQIVPIQNAPIQIIPNTTAILDFFVASVSALPSIEPQHRWHTVNPRGSVDQDKGNISTSFDAMQCERHPPAMLAMETKGD